MTAASRIARARSGDADRRSSTEARTAPARARNSAADGDRRRTLAGGERNDERHDRAARRDRRDDAHRPERERLVERRKPDPAAHAADHPKQERPRAEIASHPERDQQRNEARGLRDDRDREHREPARSEPPPKSAQPQTTDDPRARRRASAPIATTNARRAWPFPGRRRRTSSRGRSFGPSSRDRSRACS